LDSHEGSFCGRSANVDLHGLIRYIGEEFGVFLTPRFVSPHGVRRVKLRYDFDVAAYAATAAALGRG
jgi:hypothetical protein